MTKRYRIQADPKLPIARFNGQLCTLTTVEPQSTFPVRVRLVGSPEGSRPLMTTLKELVNE